MVCCLGSLVLCSRVESLYLCPLSSVGHLWRAFLPTPCGVWYSTYAHTAVTGTSTRVHTLVHIERILADWVTALLAVENTLILRIWANTLMNPEPGKAISHSSAGSLWFCGVSKAGGPHSDLGSAPESGLSIVPLEYLSSANKAVRGGWGCRRLHS